jgi:hypothetical protein
MIGKDVKEGGRGLILMNYPGTYLDRMKKTTKNLSG